MDGARTFRCVVGIATAGRPEVLDATLDELGRQVREPDLVIVSARGAEDLPARCRSPSIGSVGQASVRVVFGDAGLTRQRNAIMREAAGFDILVFLDDDFFPDPDYLAAMERAFAQQPDVVMTTGHVAADGIIGPGYDVAEGRRLLVQAKPEGAGLTDVYNGYGCNMAVRLSTVRNGGLSFDEALPLYGWLEDVDFSRRLAAHGRVVRVADAVGVHLGTKRGRQSGLRLGYSQIANPIHIAMNGRMSWPRAGMQMGRNVLRNVARAIRPEPYVDRRGRIRGNLRAAVDLVRGRLHPSRVEEF